ncbi:unnamed protein product [Ectocarpus sp. 13 AM-2016]
MISIFFDVLGMLEVRIKVELSNAQQLQEMQVLRSSCAPCSRDRKVRRVPLATSTRDGWRDRQLCRFSLPTRTNKWKPGAGLSQRQRVLGSGIAPRSRTRSDVILVYIHERTTG